MTTETVNQLPKAAVEQLVTHRFTVDKYQQMIESGILTEDDRVQLLAGVIIEMTPIGPRHRVTVTKLNELLYRVLPTGWHLACQQPIALSDSEPEPDLSIVRGEILEYQDRIPAGSDVGLVIEVADRSLELDRTQKKAIYATAGIPEYWIVNLNEKTVEVYRDSKPAEADQPARYETKQVLTSAESLTLQLGSESLGKLKVADFLP